METISLHIVVFLFLAFRIDCFNFDVDQVVIKSSKSKGALFGLSVSPHMIKDSSSAQILVGAPLDNMNSFSGDEQVPTGAVYSCPLSTVANDCNQMSVPKELNAWTHFKRKRQFLGMNIASSSVFGGKKAYTCAPRLRVYSPFDSKSTYPGSCVSFENDLKSSHHLDLGDCVALGKHTISIFCMRGMALTVNGHDQTVVGAPFESTSQKSLNSGAAYLTGHGGKKFIKLVKKVVPTPTYVGWSVGMGQIYAGNNLTVALGGPGVPSAFTNMTQKEIGMGMVQLHTVMGDVQMYRERIIGHQFGSRFGHSVLVVDVNGDGWDDLLVGAPDFRSESGSLGGGAVYVYFSSKGRVLQLKQVLRPSKMSGEECKRKNCVRTQFGFALSYLQDVNLDGYKDVGVSAPGESNGVIYVYHGSSSGLKPTPAQKIALSTAKNLGYSMGHGMDLDDNGYPDLVVGAIGSDSVAVFRARPILRIDPVVLFNPTELHPDFSKNAWKVCNLGRGYCLDMVLNVGYRPASARHKISTVYSGNLTLESDVKAAALGYAPRVKFLLSGGVLRAKRLLLVQFSPSFVKKEVTLFIERGSFVDKMNPIEFKVIWQLNMKAPNRLSPGASLPSINEFPIYDKANNFKVVKLHWTDICPSTGCTSDLELTVRSSLAREPDKKSPARFVYYMGRDNLIWMNFTVTNYVGLAHKVQLTFQANDKVTVDHTRCRFGCTLKNQEAVCGLANPLNAGQSVECSIRLTTTNLRPDMRYLNFSASVSTLSRNFNNRLTNMEFKASVKIQAHVVLSSTVDQPQIVYRSSRVIGASAILHEMKIGHPRIQTSFKVENRLTSLVPSSTLTIWWPHELVGDEKEPHGKYLLYLLKVPEIESKNKLAVTCDRAALKRLINPNDVRLLKSDTSIARNYSGTVPARYRRSVRTNSSITFPGIPDKVPCSDGIARCVPIRCHLGELGKKTGPITVKLVSRLWIHSLVENFSKSKYVKVIVSSRWESDPKFAVTQVNNTEPQTELGAETVTIRSEVVLLAVNAMQRKPEPPQNFSLIIAGAVVGGIILFGCIVIILWKCNFFKRTNIDEKREQILRQSRMHQ